MTHTPLPWVSEIIGTSSVGDVYGVNDADGNCVAECLSKKDAALIVRAVNSHTALVKALELSAGIIGDMIKRGHIEVGDSSSGGYVTGPYYIGEGIMPAIVAALAAAAHDTKQQDADPNI